VKNNNGLAFEAAQRFLVGLSRRTKTSIVVIADVVGFSFCALAACWIVAGEPSEVVTMLPIVAVTSAVSVLAVWWRGLYRAVVRYVGIELVLAALATATISALIGAVTAVLADLGVVSARWAMAYWGFAFIYVSGSRYCARLVLLQRPARDSLERVIIYGAGDAGAQLATSLYAAGAFLPVAMIDDDPTLYGSDVKGLPVYPSSSLSHLINDTKATRVLLALPSASRRARRRVLERLTEFPLHVQTMPDIKDIVSGKARVDDISDVEVKDLLGRDPVPPKPDLLDACIKGKNVLVTGAGGSIGAELCRQIISLRPARLVLLEIAESALYGVEHKLRLLAKKQENDCEILPLLGSAHHKGRVREVMETFGIQTVYHAAAYKHVPIVEQNLFEGIHNNIFGTLHTAEAAIEAGVETFVLISTDKAVNPSSVMGATKRFAELVLQAHDDVADRTRLCMVRFGNVLESSGSVVPLFRRQIRGGGPVTVTHRDIVRYFMTIPEAAQLVIQAGAMAEGGDVFVLDMGEPVKIRDLAHRMIRLMGLTVRDESNPDGDIEVQYTGLRPAEKLYEELLIGANVSGTRHPRIMRADEDSLSLEAVGTLLAELEVSSQNLDYAKARDVLLRAVREYSPQNGIDDLVWTRKTGTDDIAQSDQVIDFPKKPN